MMKNIKVVAMDLDGTLTQHRTNICEANRRALSALSEKYRLLMAGAGRVVRIFDQLEQFPVDIIGNYGLQYGEYGGGEIIMRRDLRIECDREAAAEKILYLRNKYGYTEFEGEGAEFHPSGCITFPILGTKAKQEDKLSFDPDRTKRRRIYNEVCELFGDYSVFVGGSSSFDMAPKPYNKYYALDLFCKEYGYSHDEVVFIGDDYGLGGNDESVYKSDFRFIKTDDYTKFPQIAAELL